MALNRELILFHAAMMRGAHRYHASCGGGGEAYRDRVHAAYQAAGAPRDVDAWLRDYLKDEFRWVREPPRWIADEPAWPFHDGRPMVFISQTELPDNDVTRTALVTHDTVYLFGIQVPVDGGFELKFEVVHQPAD